MLFRSQHINNEGNELLSRLLQGWLDMNAANETHKSSISTADGYKLNHVKSQTSRKLTSLFGDVTATSITNGCHICSAPYCMTEFPNS